MDGNGVGTNARPGLIAGRQRSASARRALQEKGKQSTLYSSETSLAKMATGAEQRGGAAATGLLGTQARPESSHMPAV